MADTKKDKLIEILDNLQKIGDIAESMVVSRDGLPIASNTEKTDVDTFAAMAAAMQGAAETAASELKQGNVDEIIIETEKGKIISTGAGEKAILVVRTQRAKNLGLILMEIKKSAEKVEAILK
jgi:hypothetical protein